MQLMLPEVIRHGRRIGKLSEADSHEDSLGQWNGSWLDDFTRELIRESKTRLHSQTAA